MSDTACPTDSLPVPPELEASLQELLHEQPGLAVRLEPVLASFRLLRERLAGTQILNRRLAEVTARASELVAEIGEKNSLLAVANAHAAELVAEIEIKNDKIAALNRSLAEANARAAELVAENEIRTAELAKTNARLSLAVEKQSQWVGFAAHDLRGGIGGIHGLVSMLLDEQPGSAGEPGNPLCLIEAESARLLELLSALLEIASIEQGRISLQREHTDLAELTRASFALHARAALAKNQSIGMDCAGVNPVIIADPHRIRQVIDNLVSNAIKFSYPGSAILVTIRSATGGIEWAVTDEGPGLAPGDFSKLFKSFQTLSATPTAGETSTGLGLVISRNIIELHLGTVFAENRTDGKGARFSFILPTGTGAVAQCRVVVLEPDRESCGMVCAMLSGLGHSAIPVSSLADAVPILKTAPPHVVLAEMRFSPAEIHAAAGVGSAGEKSSFPPLIGLSPSDDVEKECASLGWDGYLLKPVDGILLNAMLHRVLRLREERAAACA